jgi:hypothetical protein
MRKAPVAEPVEATLYFSGWRSIPSPDNLSVTRISLSTPESLIV